MHAVRQPEGAIANAAQRFDAQGKLTDDIARKLIGQLVQTLTEKARAARVPVRAAA